MPEKHTLEKTAGLAAAALSHIILPAEAEKMDSRLYYHTDGPAALKDGALWVESGTMVRFNTYFNGFFYPKYLHYTHVKAVQISLSLAGCFTARICCQCGKKVETISELQLCGGASSAVFPVCGLEALPKDGALFLELQAHSSQACFISGAIHAVTAPPNRVRLAAVICTYRREDYVQKNLDKLSAGLFSPGCPDIGDIDVFVIDNGGTLPPSKCPRIQILPNRNYGGSGGFARGIWEAIHRDSYTHVLLMDDDISFEVESVIRTVELLRYARELDRPLCIGGQMLLEHEPSIQYEAGGFYERGRLRGVGRGLNLSDWSAVLENEREHHVQYNAWWYCVFSLGTAASVGLPLPLFIKTDDVEYGLRIKPNVLLMNGIGVWHKAFEEKYSPHLEYYIKRNELVVSALHDDRNGMVLGIWKLIRAAGKAILVGTPKTVDFLVHAYRDFLEGPDFFLQTEEDRLNDWLRREACLPGKSRLRSVLTDPFRLLPLLVWFAFRYRTVRESYRRRLGELTSAEFWAAHLGLPG